MIDLTTTDDIDLCDRELSRAEARGDAALAAEGWGDDD
jgi:hypothetical protein